MKNTEQIDQDYQQSLDLWRKDLQERMKDFKKISIMKLTTIKTRIEVIYNETYEKVLIRFGYKKEGKIYCKSGLKYKIAWLHQNSWGQLSFIDLIEVKG